MIRLISPILITTALLVFIIFTFNCEAGNRFTANYSCSDDGKSCVSSGTRIVDGFEVHRDCWEWSYYKICHYPSKDDCKNFTHCYAIADLPCLLRDNYLTCVNLQKEFSCKSWEPVTIDKEMVRTGLVEKEGKDRLVCKGVPCIDGNCVDKSYLTDGDMMDSVSKLYAVSQMKGALDLNFKLFAGFVQSCSKKATSYTNCCSTSLKGWGKNLGAGCNKDEQDLVDKRSKNLCEYACKENKQMMGVTTVVKHHYCCFGSLLNKVIQVQGRKQLFPSKPENKLFEKEGKPDCRGLTLAEIMQLDFDKMDFSEFFIDILKRMKIPKVGDISSRVNSSLPNIRKYDGNPNNKKNNMTGWSAEVKDDSWEAEEEHRIEEERKRLEAERIERERQLALERERLRLLEEEKQRKLAFEREQLRLIEEQRRQAQLQEELRKQRKIAKENELALAKQAAEQENYKYNSWYNRVWQRGKGINPENHPHYHEHRNNLVNAYSRVYQLHQELTNGNY